VVNDSGFGEGLFEAPRVGHGDRPRRESSALHGEAPFPAEDGPGESHADADRESGEAGGERRPRRRRGRRGGRGRRTREDGRVGEGERIRGDQEPVRDDLLGAAIRPANPDDLFEGERGESPQSSDSVEPADEAAPRRRRRGRRGGRGRSRTGSGESRSVGESSNLAGGERRQPEDGEADEPLPSGYGVRPTAGRGDADERRGERPPEGDSGRPRRRGRRRRSSGDGGARAAGTEKPTSSDAGRRSSRSRRDRRPDAESRGDAGFSRRRRGDFEPVGSGHGEDDEGLEFLGIDEAGSGSSRREARAPDDDILVESGLSSVQDVPSWVEAIGIVIAGNLDARNRSPRGDEGRRTGR